MFTERKHACARADFFATRKLRMPSANPIATSVECFNQVILRGEHLLQFHMTREGYDAALQYPTRYRAEDNVTLEVGIRLNRYIAQTQVRKGKRRGTCTQVCQVGIRGAPKSAKHSSFRIFHKPPMHGANDLIAASIVVLHRPAELAGRT